MLLHVREDTLLAACPRCRPRGAEEEPRERRGVGRDRLDLAEQTGSIRPILYYVSCVQLAWYWKTQISFNTVTGKRIGYVDTQNTNQF